MKRKFIIESKKKVGDIEFGNERNLIRSIFKEFKEFKKSKFSKNTTDDFEICHVYYNIDNKCEAVEFFNESEIIFNEINLFDLNYSDVQKMFSKLDTNLITNSYEITSKEIGISISFSDRKPETILVFSEGYFD